MPDKINILGVHFDNITFEETIGRITGFLSGDKPAAEYYRNAFILARKFIFPMNPPRTELDDAIRLLFAEHGITIKKTRFNEHFRRTKRRSEEKAGQNTEAPAPPALPADAPPSSENARPPGKRRRRKRKKTEDPAL